MKKHAIALSILLVLMTIAGIASEKRDGRPKGRITAKVGPLMAPGGAIMKNTSPITQQIVPLEMLPFEKSLFRPNRMATDDIQAAQEKVATFFSNNDPMPAIRADHFAWCQTPDMRITGWVGTISDYKATAQGELVVVRVTPRLATQRPGLVTTRDYIDETYSFVNGQMSLINIEKPPAAIRTLLSF